MLEKVNVHGTGNRSVQLPKQTMIKENNTLITKDQAVHFVNHLEKQVVINFSNRKTSRRWGSADIRNNKINIYRHSVWVFLHELAHIYSRVERKGNRFIKHGKKFGQTLTDLYQTWLEFNNQEKIVEVNTNMNNYQKKLKKHPARDTKQVIKSIDLEKNTDYSEANFQITVNGQIYDLIKTTNDRAFYDENGKTRRVKFDNIDRQPKVSKREQKKNYRKPNFNKSKDDWGGHMPEAPEDCERSFVDERTGRRWVDIAICNLYCKKANKCDRKKEFNKEVKQKKR